MKKKISAYMKSYVRKFPITTLMISLNLAMFLLSIILGGASNSHVLLKLGALHKPSVEDGQYFRFITSMFLHAGFLHFFFNMDALRSFGGQKKLDNVNMVKNVHIFL